MLKRTYGIHVPEQLDEEEWLRLYAEYRMLRKTELKEIEIATYNALAKVANQIFSNGNDNTMDTGTD